MPSAADGGSRHLTNVLDSEAKEFTRMPIIDTSPLAMSSSDGLMLAGDRCGPSFAAATVVYVHGLLCDGSWWQPLTEQVHDRLDGQIAQIVWDHEGTAAPVAPTAASRPPSTIWPTTSTPYSPQATGSVGRTGHALGRIHGRGCLRAALPARAAALSGLCCSTP
ncbi:hypothetical protein LK465_27370, partial [Nocardia africana]|nr:hypothetical protein [Nocardia africana]